MNVFNFRNRIIDDYSGYVSRAAAYWNDNPAATMPDA